MLIINSLSWKNVARQTGMLKLYFQQKKKCQRRSRRERLRKVENLFNSSCILVTSRFNKQAYFLILNFSLRMREPDILNLPNTDLGHLWSLACWNDGPVLVP